jgi:hypothetical protein
VRLYHGGVPGLRPGARILPPTATDVVSSANGTDQAYVYASKSQTEARVYASRYPHGDLYRVELDKPYERDPFKAPGPAKFRARGATVIDVVERSVPRYVEDPYPDRRFLEYRRRLLEADSAEALSSALEEMIALLREPTC